MSDPTPPIRSTTEYYRPLEVLVVPPPRKQRYWLHLLLFLATLFTTLVVGAHMEDNFQHSLPALHIGNDSLFSFLSWALHPSHLALGIPFSFTLMLILTAHEMGHYLYCRHYGVDATLPFFIPFPTLIGTLGAFIRIRSPIRSRQVLFDIGIGGPIAGFLVALPVLVVALGLSKPLPPVLTLGDLTIEPGFPLIIRIVRHLLANAGLVRDIAHIPFGRICLHPTAMAAWVGMFATALNLLPGGQLDGGHIVFALAPRAHRTVSRLTILALIPMAIYFWSGWLVWAILLWISGMRHPMVGEWPGITSGRRWLAAFALLMLVVTFTPAPLLNSSLLPVMRSLLQFIQTLLPGR